MTDQVNPSVTPAAPTLNDLLAGIKREDGTQKYSSPEDALKALQASQEHIKRLEAEKRALEDSRNKTAIEQLLETMKPQPAPAAPKVETPPAVAGLTPEDVVKLLEQRDAARAAQANLGTFSSQLEAKFGAKAGEHLQKRAQELGLPVEYIANIAKASPKAAMDLIGGAAPSPAPSKAPGTVNTSALPKQPNQDASSIARRANRVGATTDDQIAAWRAAASKQE